MGAAFTKQQVIKKIREARDAALANNWNQAAELLTDALAGCRERTQPRKPERPVRIRLVGEYIKLFICGMDHGGFLADEAGIAEIKKVASDYIEKYRGAELVESPWPDWKP